MKEFQGGTKSFVNAECPKYGFSCVGKCFPKHFRALGYKNEYMLLLFPGLPFSVLIVVQVMYKFNKKKTLFSLLTVAMLGCGWRGNEERTVYLLTKFS